MSYSYLKRAFSINRGALYINKIDFHRDDILIPAAPAQHRFWILHQIENANSAYTEINFRYMRGELNANAFGVAYNRFICRHNSLRTNIALENGQLVQKVRKIKACSNAIEMINLAQFDEPYRSAEVKRILLHEANYSFDLASDPLIRLTIIQLESDLHIIAAVAHHIIFDGWSWGIFWNEMQQLYNAELKGIELNLPDLKYHYSDFAISQHRWLEGENKKRLSDFWRGELSDIPHSFDLPFMRKRYVRQSFDQKEIGTIISQDCIAKVRAICGKKQTSPFIFFLSIFNLLLWKYTNAGDIVIGILSSGRDRKELRNLIGHFITTLPIRTKIDVHASFAEFLNKTGECVINAIEHQNLPFEEIVNELNVKRDQSIHPIFQVMFSYYNMPTSKGGFIGLQEEQYPFDKPIHSQYDLTLKMNANLSKTVAWIEYNRELFESNSMVRMIGHFISLIDNVINDILDFRIFKMLGQLATFPC
jgi:hypothetical protein